MLLILDNNFLGVIVVAGFIAIAGLLLSKIVEVTFNNLKKEFKKLE